MRFNVYRTQGIASYPVLRDVTYNHALGALYRSQVGVHHDDLVNVFDIQKALNGGYCRLPVLVAIETPDSHHERRLAELNAQPAYRTPELQAEADHIYRVAGKCD